MMLDTISLKELKKGDKVTLIDDYNHVTFLRVTKIGNKYLYGRINHIDGLTGEIKESNQYDTKYEASKIVISDRGFNKAFKRQQQDIRNRIREFKQRRAKTHYEIERKIHDEARKKANKLLDEWDYNNPEPIDYIQYARLECIYPFNQTYLTIDIAHKKMIELKDKGKTVERVGKTVFFN